MLETVLTKYVLNFNTDLVSTVSNITHVNEDLISLGQISSCCVTVLTLTVTLSSIQNTAIPTPRSVFSVGVLI